MSYEDVEKRKPGTFGFSFGMRPAGVLLEDLRTSELGS